MNHQRFDTRSRRRFLQAAGIASGSLFLPSLLPGLGDRKAYAQAMPKPPSERTELPIPKELDAIVLACLAKNPSDRPQTARELARRLEAVPVMGEWTPERAQAWWETHRPRVTS